MNPAQINGHTGCELPVTTRSQSVVYNVAFVRASKQFTDIEVTAAETGRLAVRRDL